MSVNIKMICTEQDAKLLKKVICEYMAHASEKEKDDCQSFLDLITYAEKKSRGE